MLSSPLHLSTLYSNESGLTVTWGQWLAEAGSVCFKLHKHPLGVLMQVVGPTKASYQVYWETVVSEQTINNWNDDDEAAEYGAYGIAILLVLKLTGYCVVQRSKKGTGIDYWLAPKGQKMPFEAAARLEVSGIMKGTDNDINSRVRRKKAQTVPSDGKTPAYVVVVEFSQPISHFEKK